MGITVTAGEYQSYLHGKKLKQLVEDAAARLERIDFDTIAVCGISGLLVGAPLAVVMEKSLLIVRKPNEATRSAAMFGRFIDAAGALGELITDGADIRAVHGVMGNGDSQKILLLDDHISSGATLRLMVSAIDERCTKPTYVGMFLYAEHMLFPRWFASAFWLPNSALISKENGEPLKISVFTL